MTLGCKACKGSRSARTVGKVDLAAQSGLFFATPAAYLSDQVFSRLPVDGLLIHCPVCTHGGHQDCIRRYYTSQPMRSLHLHEVPARPTHGGVTERLISSAHSGTSSSNLVRQSNIPPRGPGVSLLTANAPSRAASLLSTISTVPSVIAGSTTGTVLSGTDISSDPPSLQIGVTGHSTTLSATELNASSDRDRAETRKESQMMGHPCAAGCGHYCWVASLGQVEAGAGPGFLSGGLPAVSAH